MSIQFVSEIIEENGLTVRQNNMNKTHNIPIGAIVEILPNSAIDSDLFDDEDSAAGLRLFVVEHSRDCDGTPLYALSFDRDAVKELEKAEKNYKNNPDDILCLAVLWMFKGRIDRGYSEESLSVIKK